jgi:hypothetical protein
MQEFLPTMEELKIMSKTPVEFYGRVLDQNNAPVPGTKISCSWPYMGSMHSPVRVLTGPDGCFEITGLKAISISISVRPPMKIQFQLSPILTRLAPEIWSMITTSVSKSDLFPMGPGSPRLAL